LTSADQRCQHLRTPNQAKPTKKNSHHASTHSGGKVVDPEWIDDYLLLGGRRTTGALIRAVVTRTVSHTQELIRAVTAACRFEKP